MKKIAVFLFAALMLSASSVYAAKAKADPAKTECREMAKKEGVAKGKMKAYMAKCLEDKKAVK